MSADLCILIGNTSFHSRSIPFAPQLFNMGKYFCTIKMCIICAQPRMWDLGLTYVCGCVQDAHTFIVHRSLLGQYSPSQFEK